MSYPQTLRFCFSGSIFPHTDKNTDFLIASITGCAFDWSLAVSHAHALGLPAIVLTPYTFRHCAILPPLLGFRDNFS